MSGPDDEEFDEVAYEMHNGEDWERAEAFERALEEGWDDE